jgi:NAD dependent epimerase/dehydratase family enzyme
VGSSGLVGSELLNMLTTSADYDKVISLVRSSKVDSIGKIEERLSQKGSLFFL